MTKQQLLKELRIVSQDIDYFISALSIGSTALICSTKDGDKRITVIAEDDYIIEEMSRRKTKSSNME